MAVDCVRADRLLPMLAVASVVLVVVRVHLELGVIEAREAARIGSDAGMGWLGRRRAARRARKAGVIDERTMHRMMVQAGPVPAAEAFKDEDGSGLRDHDPNERNELVMPLALSRRALAKFLDCTAEHSEDYCRELLEKRGERGNGTAEAKKADPQVRWMNKCDRACQPACLSQCKQRRTELQEAQLVSQTGEGMERFCATQCNNLCLQKCQKLAREALVPLG